jgi:hypothetical protein
MGVKFHYKEGRRTRSTGAVELDGVLCRTLGDGWAAKAVGCLTPVPAALVGSEGDEWRAKVEENRAAIVTAVITALGTTTYNERTGRGLTELEAVALAVGFAAFCRDLRLGAAHLVEAAKHGLPLPNNISQAEWAGLYLARREVSNHRDHAAAKFVLMAMAAGGGPKKKAG